MGRIAYITRKEFIQVFRDPRMFAIIFIAPMLQLFLFGYALTTDVNHIKLAVMDLDRSSDSRELQRAIFNSGYFIDAGAAESDADIEGALVHGLADIVLVIPAGFATYLARGRQATMQVLVDGAESNSAQIGAGYLSKIFFSYAQDQIAARMRMVSAKLGGAARPLPVVEAETRFRYNPELKSVNFFVPGVLAMILMVITMMLTSMAVTREREVGTMEQLVVTPIKPWQLLAGKMLPFAILGLIDVTFILVVAVGHFELPLRGSVGLLYFATAVFLFTTLGMGLFISTISQTQQQAIFVSFLIIMPAVLLSGLMFPIANMPVAVQYLTYLNPLRYYLVIVRGVILKGMDFATLAPQFYLLFAVGALVFALASARFRKTVA